MGGGGDDFEGRHLQRGDVELFGIGHRSHVAALENAARERQQKLLADEHGVVVGLPPARDWTGCHVGHPAAVCPCTDTRRL